MSKRNLQVQTPGEVPAAAPEAPQADANPAEKPAEQPKAAKKPAERPNYAAMAADDIDPYTLTAPVLSRDGWVVPVKKA